MTTTRMTLVMCVALTACGTKGPSKEAVDKFRSAQRAALEKLAAVQKDFDRAMTEIADDKWVAHPELGKCASTLPVPPAPEQDHPPQYPAWFLHKKDPMGWSSMGERVFKQPKLSIGDPDGWLPSADAIARETEHVAAFQPFDKDILVMYVDEEQDPKYTGGETFEPGFERGRAWVWSAKTHTIICAGTFDGTTPESVGATIFDRDHHDLDVGVALTLAQGRASVRSAVANLAAAGPPKN